MNRSSRPLGNWRTDISRFVGNTYLGITSRLPVRELRGSIRKVPFVVCVPGARAYSGIIPIVLSHVSTN